MRIWRLPWSQAWRICSRIHICPRCRVDLLTGSCRLGVRARLGFTIVTKDGDLRQRSFLYGAPPKMVWIQSGNCSTRQIADLLRQHYLEIEAFGLAEEPAFLSLA